MPLRMHMGKGGMPRSAADAPFAVELEAELESEGRTATLRQRCANVGCQGAAKRVT